MVALLVSAPPVPLPQRIAAQALVGVGRPNPRRRRLERRPGPGAAFPQPAGSRPVLPFGPPAPASAGSFPRHGLGAERGGLAGPTGSSAPPPAARSTGDDL